MYSKLVRVASNYVPNSNDDSSCILNTRAYNLQRTKPENQVLYRIRHVFTVCWSGLLIFFLCFLGFSNGETSYLLVRKDKERKVDFKIHFRLLQNRPAQLLNIGSGNKTALVLKSNYLTRETQSWRNLCGSKITTINRIEKEAGSVIFLNQHFRRLQRLFQNSSAEKIVLIFATHFASACDKSKELILY